ncbi:hypothetical protein DDB_G0279543 [Dictyostelium discoideum AX4]|uniref:Uncharacterized protein n=1 Tax=Dictyostelium discoideum TaxID=44689 RepID=Q54WM7_DICDI|nr:hypothetical protein DDB_G0279543 [Dictyostelium discoideum AX4]EAL67710.1 hypothetical protein DDB_G0279543 [Dictyostelium discoideum AX4]|eukprot:XP_641690.1 hypothetical protein DDB_G0279543 [Dictyostelium discoideum AX4]
MSSIQQSNFQSAIIWPQELDVTRAWLIEDLPGGRVRILTQESQNGKPARKLASTVPNPMINGHQEWITGLINSCKKNKLPSE